MSYYGYQYRASPDVIVGKTVAEVIGGKAGDGEFELRFTDGSRCVWYHSQDCCEYVRIVDVEGDVDSLVGQTIMLSEEVSSEGYGDDYGGYESYTWTFYKLATFGQYITTRWLGESNGYYGEGVDFAFFPAEKTEKVEGEDFDDYPGWIA